MVGPVALVMGLTRLPAAPSSLLLNLEAVFTLAIKIRQKLPNRYLQQQTPPVPAIRQEVEDIAALTARLEELDRVVVRTGCSPGRASLSRALEEERGWWIRKGPAATADSPLRIGGSGLDSSQPA